MFGNEDTTNWIRFWKFIKSVHPIVNQVAKTIITDQDKGKGSLASIRQIVPNAGLFHYPFHRHQNIKKFRGGEENSPLSCLWMYNILMNCSSVSMIRFLKNTYEGQMKPACLVYLNSFQDDQQSLAACCNKAHDNFADIFMYSNTASSGVESMNRANENVRGRIAIAILNAAIILLKKAELDIYKLNQRLTRRQGGQILPLPPRASQSWMRYLPSVTLLSTVSR